MYSEIIALEPFLVRQHTLAAVRRRGITLQDAAQLCNVAILCGAACAAFELHLVQRLLRARGVQGAAAAPGAVRHAVPTKQHPALGLAPAAQHCGVNKKAVRQGVRMKKEHQQGGGEECLRGPFGV